MSNHIHLLLRDLDDNLSDCMKQILGKYAHYYNHKYDRNGHLFQDRFCSRCITDGGYFWGVYRYILRNPVEAKISPLDQYPWSSFADYYADDPVTDTGIIKERFPDPKLFMKFLFENDDDEGLVMYEVVRWNNDDSLLLEQFREITGVQWGFEIADMNKYDRNEAIRKLRLNGFTIKQISRLTGIGRGIIQKVKYR